jgi:hypothetical protein
MAHPEPSRLGAPPAVTSAPASWAGQPTPGPVFPQHQTRGSSAVLPLATRTRTLSPRCLTYPSGGTEGHDRGDSGGHDVGDRAPGRRCDRELRQGSPSCPRLMPISGVALHPHAGPPRRDVTLTPDILLTCFTEGPLEGWSAGAAGQGRAAGGPAPPRTRPGPPGRGDRHRPFQVRLGLGEDPVIDTATPQAAQPRRWCPPWCRSHTRCSCRR